MQTPDNNRLKQLFNTSLTSQLRLLCDCTILSLLKTPFDRLQTISQNKPSLRNSGIIHKSPQQILSSPLKSHSKREKAVDFHRTQIQHIQTLPPPTNQPQDLHSGQIRLLKTYIGRGIQWKTERFFHIGGFLSYGK